VPIIDAIARIDRRLMANRIELSSSKTALPKETGLGAKLGMIHFCGKG